MTGVQFSTPNNDPGQNNLQLDIIPLHAIFYACFGLACNVCIDRVLFFFYGFNVQVFDIGSEGLSEFALYKGMHFTNHYHLLNVILDNFRLLKSFDKEIK